MPVNEFLTSYILVMKFITLFAALILTACTLTMRASDRSENKEATSAARFLRTTGLARELSGTMRRLELDRKQLSVCLKAQHQQLSNFPVAVYEDAEVMLHRSELPFDQATWFVTQSKHGETRCSAPQMRLWTGFIIGEAHSHIVLLSTEIGILCSIEREQGESYLLSSQPNNPTQLCLVANASMQAPPALRSQCLFDDAKELFSELSTKKSGSMTQGASGASRHTSPVSDTELYVVDLALETDTRFFQAAGGSLEKAQNYIVAVLAMVNEIYEREIGTRLHLRWLKCWTDSPADPYNCNGDPFVLFDRVKPYWDTEHKDVPRNTYQVITSVSYGGGGYGILNDLCGDENARSSASLQVQHTLPTYTFTYDSYIMAHELGHNFGAYHTHSCAYGAPLDTCVVEAASASCLDTSLKPRPNPGSIMSYCGGPNSAAGRGYQMRLRFLDPVIARMRAALVSNPCIKQSEIPHLSLSSPQGSQLYAAHEPLTIRWMSQQVNFIDIEYSNDAGVTWTTVARDVSVQTGEYMWTPPDSCTNAAMIRIRSVVDSTIEDHTILPFHISRSAPTDGLVAQYSFAQNFRNSVCGGFDDARLAQGEVAFGPDRFNRPNSAVQFDGKGYLYVPWADLSSSQLSVSLWCKADSLNGKCTMVGTNYAPATNVFEIYNWGVLGCSYYLNTGLWQFWSGSLSLKKWSHVVFSYDGNTAKTWLNNTLVKSEQHNGTLIPFITTLYIGSRRGQENFYGALDDIRIYNRSISAAEVAALYERHDDNTEVAALDAEQTPQRIRSTSVPGVFEIALSADELDAAQLQLYSLIGNEIMSPMQCRNGTSLDLRHLASGVYIARIANGAQHVEQCLIVP